MEHTHINYANRNKLDCVVIYAVHYHSGLEATLIY